MVAPRRVRFVTANPHKLREAEEILSVKSVDVVPYTFKITELQTDDPETLVRDKLLKAFARLHRPLFVEHTGLALEYLGGLPGGLTQVFWDTLQAERFAELFGAVGSSNSVMARTTVAYCDGKRIHIFVGEVGGTIVQSPRGDRAFQWDCVFVPDGSSETFAEMGSRKNEISMRRIALDKLALHLSQENQP